MITDFIPGTVPNWINGEQAEALSGAVLDKLSPHSGGQLYRVARSGSDDVEQAIQVAARAQPDWAGLTPVQRGEILHDIAQLMRSYQKDIAAVVALETGMSFCAAMGETGAAIAQGEFMAGEGRRFYARTTTSATPNK